MRKRFAILAVVVLLVAGAAWAGGDHSKSKPMTAAEKAAKLQAKLNLTDQQTSQVQALIEEFTPRFDALYARKEAGEDISAEKAKLKEAHNARLKAILTADQWARYQEMHSDKSKTKH